MDTKRILISALVILSVLIVSVLIGAAAGIIGFIFSFLIFGDGSTLYFALEKAFHVEPYLMTSGIFSIFGFIASVAVAIVLIKNRLLRL